MLEPRRHGTKEVRKYGLEPFYPNMQVMGKDIQQFVLKPTIDAIYSILRMENCKVKGVDGVPEVNRLSVNPGRMDLEFDATFRAVPQCALMENLQEFVIETEKATYQTPPYNAYFEGSITMGGEQEQHFDIRFNKLTQTAIEEGREYYWRFIYPIDGNEWFLKIQGLNYADDYGTNHFRNLIVTELDGHTMYQYSSNVNKNHWMIIESTEPVTYEEMDHRVLSITIALGFVLGKRYGDYCFHVASNEPSFSTIVGTEVLSLQETKGCPFKILHPNSNLIVEWLRQYDYQRYALDEINSTSEDGVRWFYQEESFVTMDAFSKLSQLCYKSNDMMLATSMLIDGSLMNLEYQKPFFHIALETITSSLLKDRPTTTQPPMPQKQFRKDVLPVLVSALKDVPDIPDDARRIYNNRIEHQLNKPTNEDKLTICFEKCGCPLTDADKEAIKNRNITFHGHLSSEKKPLREQKGEMLSMSLRLHKLCSILVLKEAGFKGKVINNEVLFGIQEACERREPVYIEI